MIGRTISHYQIVDELGAGGMGVVYRARDTLLQRFVALKLLPADAVADEGRRRRFLQEARAASALNHPHIVTIYDVIDQEDIHAIVMEMVEGTSLQQRLSSGPLPVQQALVVARQIADALTTAHAAGIVHRDLKPANVMLTERGNVKVLDFGIAKLDPMRADTDDGTRTAPVTLVGSIMGTAAYMSPEQARGEGVDARTDVFSLGVVMYEMLSGSSPFAASTITAVLHKLIYEEPPELSSYGVELSPGVAATIRRAMAKKPVDRFQSMEALIAVLDDVSTGRGAPAPPASRSRSKAGPGAGRHRLVLAGLVMAVLALGGLFGAWKAGWLARDDPRQMASSAETELPATPYEAYQQGQALLGRYDREGYIDRSIENFRRAIDLRPEYPAAYAGLGMAYWRKYREQRDPMWLKMAGENARRAVALDPQLAIGHVSLAFVNVETGDLDAAERTLQDALTRDPRNVDALAALATLRLRQRKIPEAVEAVRTASGIRPDDWSLPLMEGVILMTAGRHAEAVSPLERAASLAGDSALVHRNLGAAYHAVSRPDDAARSFQRALEIKPDPAVYNNLGTLFFFRGLYDQAVGAFEQAVKLAANEYRSWSNLADAYRFIPGHEDDARQAYTRALQLLDEQLAAAPNDVELASRRAVMLAKRGDCGDALSGVEARHDASAKSPAALYRLAVAREVCGARDRALETLFSAIKAGYPVEQVVQDPELVRLRSDVRYHRFVSALPPASTRKP